MRLVYQLIVLYLAAGLTAYLFRERKVLSQIGAGLILVMFLLRLLLVK
jgi:hypothetical protein